MLTILEVAARVGKDPETIRRWVRAGKLPARKVGLQYVIDESDVPHVADQAPVPAGWGETATGEPMPDVVAAVSRSRSGH